MQVQMNFAQSLLLTNLCKKRMKNLSSNSNSKKYHNKYNSNHSPTRQHLINHYHQIKLKNFMLIKIWLINHLKFKC